MSKHTAEPWGVHDYDDATILVRSIWTKINKPGESSGYGSGHGLHIANLKHQGDNPCVSKEVALANAHRIVACVNALKGFSTSDLEAGVVGEMVDILTLLDGSDSLTHNFHGRIRGILSKIKEDK